MTTIYFEGGQRDGEIARVDDEFADERLVYDGPKWIGVYARAEPPRTVPTIVGPAGRGVGVAVVSQVPVRAPGIPVRESPGVNAADPPA